MVLLWSLVLSFTFTTCFPLTQPKCHENESDALLQFKKGFIINKSASDNPFSYPKTVSWNASNECCSWDGIQCDEHTDHVIHIDLSSSQLYGTMDANTTLFRFVHLRHLDLSDNDFNYSQIPPMIGELSQLRYLNLSHKFLFGEIPPQVSQLSNLVSLDLSFHVVPNILLSKVNLLQLKQSSFKSIIQNSTKLEILRLNYVTISSTLPYTLTNLTSLQILSLSNSELYGEFPVGVFHLPNLKFLDLRYNPNLNGNLHEIQSKSLSKLFLDETGFGDTLPISIGNLSSLNILSINGCDFFGYIPSSFGNLTQLMQISLGHNKFRGDPSASLEKLTKLNKLVVGFNEFTFETISWIGKLSSIFALDISSVNIGCDIPLSFANLTLLEILIADNSSIKGEIPSCISSQSLVNLVLRGNMLSGLIPQTYKIGNALRMMDLSNNNLQGQLPRTLVNNKRLEYFDISNNSINDSFPLWLGDLPELKVLDLSYNEFHGDIRCCENVTHTFPKLHIISLSHNAFSGSFPSKMIQSWKAMKTSDTGQLQYEQVSVYSRSYKPEKFSAAMHIFYSFAISNKGHIMVYEKLQEFYSMIAIDISSNKISGEIPKVLGDLRGLVLLNLSNNNFVGSIPLSLGKLSKLEALDLSFNSLSGKIPLELTQLTFLEFLNVSFNNLAGPIPQNEQFSTFEGNSFEGNQGLCGDQLINKCIDHPGTSSSDDGHDSESFFEIEWKVSLIGYVGGLVAGVALGTTYSSKVLRWLKRFF